MQFKLTDDFCSFFFSEEKLKVDARKTLIMNDEGAEIDSIDVIRDNDKLFIVTEEHMTAVASMDSVSGS